MRSEQCMKLLPSILVNSFQESWRISENRLIELGEFPALAVFCSYQMLISAAPISLILSKISIMKGIYS